MVSLLAFCSLPGSVLIARGEVEDARTTFLEKEGGVKCHSLQPVDQSTFTLTRDFSRLGAGQITLDRLGKLGRCLGSACECQTASASLVTLIPENRLQPDGLLPSTLIRQQGNYYRYVLVELVHIGSPFSQPNVPQTMAACMC